MHKVIKKRIMKKCLANPIFSAIILLGSTVILTPGCSDEESLTVINSQTGTGVQTRSVSTNSSDSLFVANEVIVKFKSNSSSAARDSALSNVSGVVAEKILTSAMKRNGDKDGVTLVKTSKNVQEAVGLLKKLGAVEYAEPNYIYTIDEAANDTYFTDGTLWGMYGSSTSPANQFGCDAASAWAAGHTGSGDIYVGIIDEGYMYTHEDLAANAGTNPGEIAGNRIDDDGNGYVDDVYGWNFAGNNNKVFDAALDDHGTHVAGIIGASGNNGVGVAGVCWNVKLLSGKFMGRKGGTTADAIKAIDYFTELKKAGVNIVATNNSWSGSGYSQALYDAIERANAAGIIFVAAAGNDGFNDDGLLASYPAAYSNSNIISVASITSTGALSSFSNYGPKSVDLAAPGSDIMSCVPLKSKGNVYSSYAFESGTSMAAPHVTGAVVLYLASHPGATVSETINAILSSAIPTASLSGKCVTGGRLNVSDF